MPIVEKIPHVYNMTGKELATKCGFKGVVVAVSAEPATIQTGDDKGKTMFNITVKTVERAESQ